MLPLCVLQDAAAVRSARCCRCASCKMLPLCVLQDAAAVRPARCYRDVAACDPEFKVKKSFISCFQIEFNFQNRFFHVMKPLLILIFIPSTSTISDYFALLHQMSYTVPSLSRPIQGVLPFSLRVCAPMYCTGTVGAPARVAAARRRPPSVPAQVSGW